MKNSLILISPEPLWKLNLKEKECQTNFSIETRRGACESASMPTKSLFSFKFKKSLDNGTMDSFGDQD